MKKFIYLLSAALFIATTFTACTDEEVAPAKAETNIGGGAGSADLIK